MTHAMSLDFTSTLELWRPRIVQFLGLSWSGCMECDHDHEQEGDDQGQHDHHFHQHLHPDIKTQIPGGERKDATNIIGCAPMSRVDQTFPLLVCQ